MSTRGSGMSSRRPIFEGFTVQTKDPDQEGRVVQALESCLQTEYEVKPFGDEGTDYEVRTPKGALPVDEAWEKAYQLRAQPGIVYAEPIFAVSVSAPPEFEDEPPTPPQAPPETGRGTPPEGLPDRSGFGDSPHLEKSKEPDWNIRQLRVDEAWKEFARLHPDKVPGQGVLIGHPDTGYSEHPEIVANLLLDDGWDFVENQARALDPLENRFPWQFPGHGTSTASVIISPPEPSADFKGGNVMGVAPGAKVIPLRVSKSVIHVSMFNVANAIERAADVGAHVISMSLGGLFSYRLRKAVVYAQKRGVIVVAAAGNQVGFVVWPAAYEEVIAVAASNADGQPWAGSSHGSAVDVTAPGESVWVAGTGEREGDFIVRRSSGTSFATAAVAGVAALWLSYHGPDRLKELYGPEKIPFIFNQILRDTCDPVEWAAGGYGLGLVNAQKVLTAKLPDGVDRSVVPPAFGLQPHVPLDSGGLQTFAHIFEGSMSEGPVDREFGANPFAYARLRSKLAELLNTKEEQVSARLKEVGQEVAFHLTTDPELYRAFSDSVASDASGGSGDVQRSPGDRSPTPRRNVEKVRARLMEKGVSTALRAKLAP